MMTPVEFSLSFFCLFIFALIFVFVLFCFVFFFTNISTIIIIFENIYFTTLAPCKINSTRKMLHYSNLYLSWLGIFDRIYKVTCSLQTFSALILPFLKELFQILRPGKVKNCLTLAFLHEFQRSYFIFHICFVL